MNPKESSHHVRIAIIGAGFGGIGIAARLVESGERNFLILEKNAGVGGTWWLNRYPGCACDVPSNLYSFSFAPEPNWSQRFAPRTEIQAYLDRCVDRFELNRHLRLNCDVAKIQWDESRRYWHIADNNDQHLTADFVISAIGGLSRPAWPDIPGLDTFGGRVIHSQHWDDTEDLHNQHVAVVGTGASAVQLVPNIVDQVRQLDIYQRTPNWILPRSDRAISPLRQTLYQRLPWLQKLARFSSWCAAELRVPGLMWSNRLAWGHRLLARLHLRRQISDPELRSKLKPGYAIGCKRVLLASDYYPAMMRNNVELVTCPIKSILRDAIIDKNDRQRRADTLILATGFRATEPVPAGMILGCEGQDLHQAWQTGPQAYRGSCVAGFPNLFMLLGPNTALGHNSVIVMIEAQIEYTLSALQHLRKNGFDRIEADTDAQRRYNEKLQSKLTKSVWNNGGCGSWYLHHTSGLNTTLWPGFTWQYQKMMKHFEPQDFKLT